jgi:endoglucanase
MGGKNMNVIKKVFFITGIAILSILAGLGVFIYADSPDFTHEAIISGSNADRSVSFSKINASDFLKANGTVLRNNYGNGNIVNLRGTNLGGWLLQEPWMSPCSVVDEWNLRETLTKRFGEATKERLIKTYQKAWLQESDLDNIKNMGMNLVRVPVLYLELMDKYGNWKSNAWENLDWLVSNCSSRGLYVLIDLHGTFGGQNTFDNCGEVNSDPQLWKNNQYQDRTVALWEGIAAHFKGNPAVAGYDLLNEPNVVSANQLNTYYNRLYKAIRAIDPDHLICLEAAWDWNQLYAPSTFGWTNVMYQLHYYAMANNESSDWNVQNNLINNAIAGMKSHQSSWNIPVLAGEFCLFDFYDLWEKFYSQMNSINVSWTNWTYKVTSNYKSWGLYYNNPSQVPNLNNDSADTIAAKWKMFSTNYFQSSTVMQDIIKKYAQVPPAVEILPSSWISIKAEANSQYVCAESAGSSPLTARSTAVEDWEKYKIIENYDGTISLQSKANNLYVCADLNQSAKVIARSNSIDTWEKFRKVALGNNTFGLQAMANNKYVCADLDSGNVLYANRDSINGAWEAFTFADAQ